MGVLNIFAILFVALWATAAELDIPSVDAAVAAALKDYGNYGAYTGPEKKAPPKANTATLKENKAALEGSSYWLESISHQGVSAFGASGYQVFRNVKDFGARGN
jgi:glucan 1,3-beta-glucosidase